MPRLIMQVAAASGKMIENARWAVDFPWLQEGHIVSLSVPVKDPALIGYAAKAGGSECVVDKDGSKYSMSLNCKVVRLRHMVSTESGTAESMAIVVPVNRLVEHVLVYVYHPAQCDQRFVAMIRGSQAAPKAV